MSDDDEFMMESGEEEDYGFQYEDDEDDGHETDADIENTYYHAKGLKSDDPAGAIETLKKVIEMEQGKGDWGFKALKQLIKISYRQGDIQNTLQHYRQLLTYTRSAVTRNYSEKSINNILDFVSSSSNTHFMEQFYAITLDALEEQRNDRLWFKANLKLAKLWLDRHEYHRLNKLLRQLHEACRKDDGSDDQSKGTSLLEVYALEIQMYTETKDNKKLKELYHRALRVKSAIPHPRIMGIIRECGGKMHASEKQWQEAQIDFFESFRNFDEAGSGQRLQVLKYLVLTNMLMESEIDPFDSQETKPYKNDPQIQSMTALVNAYQRNDVFKFDEIIKNNEKDIMGDPFIRTYIDDVQRSLKSQVIYRIIQPYTQISLQSLASELSIGLSEVEELTVFLILDGKINGRIDQVRHILQMCRSQSVALQRISATAALSRQLNALWNNLIETPKEVVLY